MTNEKHLYRLGLALTVLTVLELSTSNSAEAATFTVGGFTWDQANSVSTAEIVQGSMEEMAFITPFGQGFTEFDPSQSVGQLLGYNPNPAYSSIVPFPDSNGSLIVPNQDRATIKLTWDNRLLPNLAGDDFVIYESGNPDAPEGFSVSVLKYGESQFRTRRYEFADEFDDDHLVFGTAFNLDDFGLESGDLIIAIAIGNLFNSEAVTGADLVDDPSGEGNLLSPGDSGGYDILTSPLGSEYATDKLDADIVYAVGLHNVVPVPEPLTILGSATALGIGGLLKREHSRKQKKSE